MPLESVSATTINGDDGEGAGDDRGEAEAVAVADGAVEGPQATSIKAAITHARDTIMERRPSLEGYFRALRITTFHIRWSVLCSPRTGRRNSRPT
jgi:hypothetical protein